MNTTSDKALFCPACGSAAVNASSLAGASASCGICTWNGAVADCPTFHFKHGFTSQEEVTRAFFLDLRKLMSKQFALDLGRMLMKWGFLEDPNPKALARYVAAAARAVASSIFEERMAMEKEKVHGKHA